MVFCFFCFSFFFCLFFFFQAEDGIRDWSVTGVQTCALPILRFGTEPRVLTRADFEAVQGRATQAVAELAAKHDRSEERRGGEECRSRWSPYH